MPEPSLIPAPFLGNHASEVAGTRLTEIADLALVSVATPLGGELALSDALRASFGTEPPAVGHSTRSADGTTRFLGLASDQFLALLPAAGPLAAPALRDRLGSVAYLTDQTDAWVMLRLEGPGALRTLERICPLDLQGGAFPDGRVARTVTEHLGTILLREAGCRFLLMSVSSSARSFLHVVEGAVRVADRW